MANQYTIHSAPGCEIDTTSTAPEGFKVAAISSKVSHPSCGSTKGENAGCAFVDNNKASAGAPFNSQGGGTFAMEWTSDGIKIWSFPRGDEPSDIDSQSPSPNDWDTKYLKAAWSSHSCDTAKYFQQHAVTFDTTLCGAWAGSAYRACNFFTEHNVPAKLTFFSAGGKSQCEEYVKTGSHFKEAYWAINSVSVFQM